MLFDLHILRVPFRDTNAEIYFKVGILSIVDVPWRFSLISAGNYLRTTLVNVDYRHNSVLIL